LNASTEYDLIIRLQNDDAAAFDALYEQYHHAIYFNVLKLLRDESGAEDIVQEVFIALWEKRKEINPTGVANWLFVVSYNRSVAWLKQRLRQSLIVDQSTILAAVPEINELHTEERLNKLQEALAQLSPQRRKVFELCKMQGKSYEETARELQLSRHTVKEYLSAAVTGIKEYLQQHYRQEMVILLLVAGGWLLATGYWVLAASDW
jgi:RNA polymerase sigma-70 factor (ECF subfamily)